MNFHTSAPTTKRLAPLRDFMRTEGAGGALLVAATVLALLWANSPWKGSYQSFWHTDIGLAVGSFDFTLDLRHWVNDGLMTLFFFVVGLEIKREITTGHLASRRAATLPIVAAIGGMAVPALIYLLIAGRDAPNGWGVPMATDIALAVGVLLVMGKKIPTSVRVFLLGLAVVDDIGAILVIAIFYSDNVSFRWLAIGAVLVGLSVIVRTRKLWVVSAYVLLGAALWYALHEAGIHPTLTGVFMGLLAPAIPRVWNTYVDVEKVDIEKVDVEKVPESAIDDARRVQRNAKSSVSIVEWFEHLLHPWTSYLIVPVFALANAGIELSADTFERVLSSTVGWGIFIGLVVGKPLGILGTSLLVIRAGSADRPSMATTKMLLGAGHAGGVGFTVALFVAELAFKSETDLAEAKIAILAASIVSAVLSIGVLSTVNKQRARTPKSGLLDVS